MPGRFSAWGTSPIDCPPTAPLSDPSSVHVWECWHVAEPNAGVDSLADSELLADLNAGYLCSSALRT